MKERERIVAIACADIHLSETAPACRAVEDDWYVAQRRPLQEIRLLAQKHQCPVLVAGDVFDRSGAHPRPFPAKLINFAIREVPKCHAIPGNHDLPWHSLEYIQDSAYWTLVEAGNITEVSSEMEIESLVLHPFPFGKELHACRRPASTFYQNIAMVHRFLWNGPKPHPEASQEMHVDSLPRKFKGYDLAVFGDHHRRFTAEHQGMQIVNCGPTIRRLSPERMLHPAVTLISSDGDLHPYWLDVSRDKFVDVDKIQDQVNRMIHTVHVGGILKSVADLGECGADFVNTVKRRLASFSMQTQRIVLETLEEAQKEK